MTTMNDCPGPTTLRFTIGWKNCGRRRMSFIQSQDRKSPGKSPAYREILLFKADYDEVKRFWNSPLYSSHVATRARLGTRRRFRDEVEAARAMVAFLGWTLTAAEENLLQAIEAYGREHAAERAAA